jgi:hypothetical protein
MAKEPAKPKRPPRWTYQLRLLGTRPNKITMDRLAEYMAEFAALLGTDNQPVFKGLKNASAGLLAKVPDTRATHAHMRIVQAKNEPHSRPSRHLQKINDMIDMDGLPAAELRDQADNVVLTLLRRIMQTTPTATLYQAGTVDGTVTGMVGADDTMHLHLRDWADRDIRIIVKSEALARELLKHFRLETIRVTVEGLWKRTDMGWIPENNRCTARSFEALRDDPLDVIMDRFVAVPGNGWKKMKDPMGFLRELRGSDE